MEHGSWAGSDDHVSQPHSRLWDGLPSWSPWLDLDSPRGYTAEHACKRQTHCEPGGTINGLGAQTEKRRKGTSAGIPLPETLVL